MKYLLLTIVFIIGCGEEKKQEVSPPVPDGTFRFTRVECTGGGTQAVTGVTEDAITISGSTASDLFQTATCKTTRTGSFAYSTDGLSTITIAQQVCDPNSCSHSYSVGSFNFNDNCSGGALTFAYGVNINKELTKITTLPNGAGCSWVYEK